jgi:hypothetical protein
MEIARTTIRCFISNMITDSKKMKFRKKIDLLFQLLFPVISSAYPTQRYEL